MTWSRVWSVMAVGDLRARRGATSRRGRSTARRIFPRQEGEAVSGTFLVRRRLPGLRRAGPSAPLDASPYGVVVPSLPWHAAWLQHRRGMIPCWAGTGRADDRHGHVGVVRQPD